MRIAAALCLAALTAAGATRAAPVRPAALDRLPTADVVILGEVHDNPAHHANQARAIAAMRPAAMVWEMLAPVQAARVTPDLVRQPAVLARVLDWQASGWPGFALYAPVFAAAPDTRHYGAAVSRDRLRPVIGGDLSAFPELTARFGIARALPMPQAARRETLQQEAHCGALPPDLLPGMVRAQRMRDAALADAVLRAMDDTGGPVAVITGNGHARVDWGIPALLRDVAPDLRVLSLGQVERPAAPPLPYDLHIVTDAAPRDDPCAAFE